MNADLPSGSSVSSPIVGLYHRAISQGLEERGCA